MNRRRLAFAVVAVVLVTTLAASGARDAATATASNAPADPIWWLSTGDSYSSGEGVYGNDGACAHSPDAWGPAAARTLRSESWQIAGEAFSACSGHLVEDFYNRRNETGKGSLWEWSLQQQRPPDDKFDVITMSFGGNDIGFADAILDCLHLPDGYEDITGDIGLMIPGVGDDCDVTEDQLKKRIDNLVEPANDCGVDVSRRATETYDCAIAIDDTAGTTGGLSDFWATVAQRALAPDGRLIVVGYPKLFANSSDWGSLDFWRCSGVTRGDANMLGRVSEYLDSKLKDAVKKANDKIGGDRIKYVSVLDAFNGHGLCSGDQWINSMVTLTREIHTIRLPDGKVLSIPEIRWQGAFHPTAAGHAEEARLVAQKLRDDPPGSRSSGVTPPPTSTTTTTPSSGSDFCDTLVSEQERILQGLSDAEVEADALEAQGQSGLAVLNSLGSISVAIGELRVYFERLAAVGPPEIEDDLWTVVHAYEAADESLGAGLLAALDAGPALDRVNGYAVAECGRGV